MTTIVFRIRLSSLPIRVGNRGRCITISLRGCRGVVALTGVGIVYSLILNNLHKFIVLIHRLVERPVIETKHRINMLLIDKIVNKIHLTICDEIIVNDSFKAVLKMWTSNSSLSKTISSLDELCIEIDGLNLFA